MSIYSNLRDRLPKVGYFSSIPALIIDRCYLEEPRNFFSQAWQFIRIRITFLLFVALAAVDLVVAGLLALRYAAGSFFTSDALQTKRLQQQQTYATIFSKSLYALLASVIGLVDPKLIIFYFTPEKISSTGVTAGGDYHHASNAERKEPTTPEELQAIVLEAIRNGHKIIPVGAGRSQGKQFLPEGDEQQIVVDLSHFNSVEIHTADKIAIVGAGTLWSDLQLKADPLKLAVKVMQASNVFSVGGSIGTNIHGWDYKSGVISNTIRSMDIITPTGEFKTLTPTDELFHMITGGFGLYGIVYRVTMELADNEELQRQAISIAPEHYVDYFNTNLRDDPDTRLHLYRLSLDPNNLLGEGFTETYTKTNGTPVITPNLSVEPAQGTRTQRVLVNIARRLDWLRKLWWDNERSDFLANHPVMTTNEIMQAPINAMFNPSVSESEWLQEFFLPGETLDEFLKEFGQLLMDNDVTLLNATVRYVKKHDKSPLSCARDGDRFAVVICFNQPLQASQIIKVRKWLRTAQKLAIQKGGTYYLPYQHVSLPE